MDQGRLWHGLERYGAFSFSGTRGPVNGCDGDGVHVIIVVTPLNVNVQLEQVDSSLEVEVAAVEEAAVNRSSGGGPEFEHALMTTVMMMVKSRTLELSDDDDDEVVRSQRRQLQAARQKNKGGAPPPPSENFLRETGVHTLPRAKSHLGERQLLCNLLLIRYGLGVAAAAVVVPSPSVFLRGSHLVFLPP